MQPARKPVQNSKPVRPRSERLEARIPPDLKALYATAADLCGQTLTDFVLSTVTDAARRIVRENEVLEWTRRDQQTFAAALMHPPAPALKLAAAAEWSREQTGPHD